MAYTVEEFEKVMDAKLGRPGVSAKITTEEDGSRFASVKIQPFRAPVPAIPLPDGPLTDELAGIVVERIKQDYWY